MQCVILAAGRGSRMGELTDNLPKPMLQVGGKTLLEHKFDILPESVDEIVLVVGYLKEVIQKWFGDSYNGKKLTYVTQENITGGTADALWKTKHLLTKKFFVLMGDDIYNREDIEACLSHEWTVLVKRVLDTSVGGRIVLDKTGRVEDIVEGNAGGEGFVSTGMFSLDPRIFEYSPAPKSPGSSETGIPQTALKASKESGIALKVVETSGWISVSNHNDLLRAEEMLGEVNKPDGTK